MVRFLTVFSVYEKKVEKSQINHLPFLLKLNPRVFSYPVSYTHLDVYKRQQEQIGVALIGAVAEWVTPRGKKARDAFAAWLHAYQAGCAKDSEKFYGIHLDVEPHQLPDWQENEALVHQQYADFLVWARELCQREGIAMEADIPFWFDSLNASFQGQSMSLGEIALHLCDATLLMSYRDNAEAILALSLIHI